MTGEHPVLEWDSLIEDFDGDVEFIREIFETVDGQFVVNLPKLKAAVDAGSEPDTASLAHSLAGSALSLRALHLGDRLRELENRASDGVASTQGLLADIEQAWCQARESLTERLTSNDGTSASQ